MEKKPFVELTIDGVHLKVSAGTSVLEAVLRSGREIPELMRLRERLDPFALAESIDRQLERIYALASRRPVAAS